MTSRGFRVASAVMAALFAFAAAVQVNDPDPIRWAALYGTACAVSLAAALSRIPAPAVCGAVSLIAFAWAAAILADGPGPSDYLRMFDAWEMRSEPIEEAREASGLLIVGVWMAVLTVRAVTARRPPHTGT